MKKHYTIPFFIPHEGCPFKCVFCDQRDITGREKINPEHMADTVNKHLSTIREDDAVIEIGFFGGTFTGLPEDVQEKYLSSVYPFFENGTVDGIRLSTRPDMIDEKKLGFLKSRGVTCIELGVQSMSDKVLQAVKRGYTPGVVEEASMMVRKQGFILGHQMMVGLPLSGRGEEYHTARKARELGAEEVRIYPLVVIKGTELAEMWRSGHFSPIGKKEAVDRCMELMLYFELYDIKVIRCGLHPSKGLIDNTDFLDGPFHPSFRYLVDSRIYGNMLERVYSENGRIDKIFLNPGDKPAFWGYKKENRQIIKTLTEGKADALDEDPELLRGEFRFESVSGTGVMSRKKLAAEILPEELLYEE